LGSWLAAGCTGLAAAVVFGVALFALGASDLGVVVGIAGAADGVAESVRPISLSLAPIESPRALAGSDCAGTSCVT